MHIKIEREYDAEGHLLEECHYQDNKLQDPEDGTPAVREYDAEGHVLKQEHWQDNKLQDPAEGTKS